MSIQEVLNRKCAKCNIVKTRNEFYRNRNKRGGINHTCKKCSDVYYAQWKATHEPQLKAYMTQYYADNPDKWAESNDKSKARRRSSMWLSFRHNCMHHHNLTVEYAQYLRDTHDMCAICKTVFDWDGPAQSRQTKWRSPSIDHLVPAQCETHRYMIQNVSVICFECNTVKRHHTSVELAHLVRVGALGTNWLTHIRKIQRAEYEILANQTNQTVRPDNKPRKSEQDDKEATSTTA